jgi:hypothetical protein
MVAVQVGEEDGVAEQWVDSEPAHGDQRRRAAVEEEAARVRFHVDASLHATAASEGVTASQESGPDLGHRGPLLDRGAFTSPVRTLPRTTPRAPGCS